MELRIFLILVNILSVLMLGGCANGYYQAYNGYTYPNNKGNCRISGGYTYGNEEDAISKMAEKGFTYVGNSVFESSDSYTRSDALAACDDIGADVVIIMQPFNSGNGVVPIVSTQYHPGQTTYNTSMNWNGGYTTTTGWTPGYTTTSVNYIQYSTFTYGALFFKKKSKPKKKGRDEL